MSRRSAAADVGSKASARIEPARCRSRQAQSTAVAATIETLRKKGFGRLLVDGRAVAFDDVDPATLVGRTTLQVVVDRLQIGGEDLAPAADRFDRDGLPRRRRRGVGVTARAPAKRDMRGSRTGSGCEPRFTSSPNASSAATAASPYEDPQPRLFSFNNPFGACPTCHGFGNIIELDMDLVVPDPTKSIAQNAIEPWSKPHYRAQLAELKRAAKKAKSVSMCHGRS